MDDYRVKEIMRLVLDNNNIHFLIDKLNSYIAVAGHKLSVDLYIKKCIERELSLELDDTPKPNDNIVSYIIYYLFVCIITAEIFTKFLAAYSTNNVVNNWYIQYFNRDNYIYIEMQDRQLGGYNNWVSEITSCKNSTFYKWFDEYKDRLDTKEAFLNMPVTLRVRYSGNVRSIEDIKVSDINIEYLRKQFWTVGCNIM